MKPWRGNEESTLYDTIGSSTELYTAFVVTISSTYLHEGVALLHLLSVAVADDDVEEAELRQSTRYRRQLGWRSKHRSAHQHDSVALLHAIDVARRTMTWKRLQ